LRIKDCNLLVFRLKNVL